MNSCSSKRKGKEILLVLEFRSNTRMILLFRTASIQRWSLNSSTGTTIQAELAYFISTQRKDHAESKVVFDGATNGRRSIHPMG